MANGVGKAVGQQVGTVGGCLLANAEPQQEKFQLCRGREGRMRQHSAVHSVCGARLWDGSVDSDRVPRGKGGGDEGMHDTQQAAGGAGRIQGAIAERLFGNQRKPYGRC